MRANRPARTNLRALLALVAGSTIVAAPTRRAQVLFSDWESQRKSSDVDALVLAWIASHVRASHHGGYVN